MELTYGLQIFQQNPGSVEIKKITFKIQRNPFDFEGYEIWG